MASRSQILADNQSSFPNNTTALITPQILRDYNAELANSVVFNDQTGSMSVANATTAANATSASYALTASFALNGGGGGTIDTGSFATTGSNTFTGIQTYNANTTFNQLSNFNAAINTGNAINFTASRFASSVANFADMEMLDQNRFGFNVKDKNALTSGSEFTATVNSGSQFAEIGFDAYYGGTIGELTLRNESGIRTFEIRADRSNIYSPLNIVGAVTASAASIPSITGSLNGTASFATTASFALNAGTTVSTGSLLTTASVSLNTITFTKGDASTFAITVDTGSGGGAIDTGSFATTGSNTFTGNQIITTAGNTQLDIVSTNPSGQANLEFQAPTANFRAHGLFQINNNGQFGGSGSIQFIAKDNNVVFAATDGFQFGQANSTGNGIESGFVTINAPSGSQQLQLTGSLNVSSGITGSSNNLFNGNQTITGSIFLNGNIEGPLAGADFGNQVLIQTSSRVTFVMDSPTQSLSFTNHPALNELMIVNNEANEKIIGFDYDRWTTNIKYGLETGVDFRGIDTLSGKLNITSSTGLIGITGSLVDIAGTTTYTGSLLGKPQSFQTTERPFPILEATDGSSTGGNIIISRGIQAAATGSVHVTGSNNLISLSNGLSNTFVTNGRGAIIRGTNSIFLGAAPQITGSNGSGYNRPAPTFVNSINAGSITVTDNRPTTTTAPLSFTNNNNNGSITATLTTGSVSVFNNIMFGAATINVTGSNGTARSISSNIIGSFLGNRIEFGEGSTGGNVVSSILVGQLLTASFTDTNVALNSVSVLGYQLAVSGSGPVGSTTLYGSAYVGRWNAQDSTSQPGTTVFAVGAGTSNAARKTSLHVSSSGLTSIRDGLNVTGSLNTTGSFNLVGSASISQTLQLSGQDPLPTGATGMLAVSQSLLWFYDATQWRQVSLV